MGNGPLMALLLLLFSIDIERGRGGGEGSFRWGGRTLGPAAAAAQKNGKIARRAMGGGEENNRFILNVTRAEGARAAKSLTPGFSSLSPPSVRPAADDFIQILMTAAVGRLRFMMMMMARNPLNATLSVLLLALFFIKYTFNLLAAIEILLGHTKMARWMD